MITVERLKHLRKSKGLTQSDLAGLVGVSRNTVVNWETGKRSPRADDITHIASVLEVSESELLNEQLQHNDSRDAFSFEFWSRVADEAVRLSELGDKNEISLILPILKFAYETLAFQ